MKEFFQFAQINKSLQRRLIDYFNATWSKRKVELTNTKSYHWYQGHATSDVDN